MSPARPRPDNYNECASLPGRACVGKVGKSEIWIFPGGKAKFLLARKSTAESAMEIPRNKVAHDNNVERIYQKIFGVRVYTDVELYLILECRMDFVQIVIIDQ